LEKELASLRHLFLAEKVPPPPVRLNLRVAGQAIRDYSVKARSNVNCYDGSKVLVAEGRMYAVEFEADIRDGVVKIPEEYARLKNTHARIVVLLEGEGTDSELHALSNHAAGNVEEWKDPSEDEVWK